MLLIERVRLQKYLTAADAEDIEGSSLVFQFIQKYYRIDSLPDIVFLTVAISIASCERSFSKLKLVNHHLISTIHETRLTGLAMLSVERNLADKINFDYVIQDFAKSKTLKINLYIVYFYLSRIFCSLTYFSEFVFVCV